MAILRADKGAKEPQEATPAEKGIGPVDREKPKKAVSRHGD